MIPAYHWTVITEHKPWIQKLYKTKRKIASAFTLWVIDHVSVIISKMLWGRHYRKRNPQQFGLVGHTMKSLIHHPPHLFHTWTFAALYSKFNFKKKNNSTMLSNLWSEVKTVNLVTANLFHCSRQNMYVWGQTEVLELAINRFKDPLSRTASRANCACIFGSVQDKAIVLLVSFTLSLRHDLLLWYICVSLFNEYSKKI